MPSAFRFAPAFLSFSLLAGCVAPRQASHAPAAPISDAAFNQIATDYLAGYLAWRPQTGTYIGLHQYDGKITDFSRKSLDSELARMKAFHRRLQQLEPETLSKPAQFDYRLLRSAIKREIFSFEQAKIYSQNPMTYAGTLDLNIYIKRDFAPKVERLRSMTAILENAPAIMAAARVNLAGSLPQPQIETAIEQAEGTADFLATDVVEAVKELENKPEFTSFKTANERAVSELKSYASYLKQQKLPQATQHFALGRSNYIKLLEYGEMLTLPPEELLKIGLHELKLKQEVFARTAREIDPTKTPIEVFKAIQQDHPTAQSLIPDTARDLEYIRQFVLDRGLVSIPSSVRAKVAETPKFMRSTTFASMDTPGPFETVATEAYYYVTPVEPDWSPKQQEEWLTAFNFYTTDIVSIHEAYPGHYVQFLCLNNSSATRLQKIFNSYAFTEGWAHYCEQMMVDEGFAGAATNNSTEAQASRIRAAKYRLAQIDEALLRICRLCVSIKMHCQGMTVEEAAKFFEDNCYYEPKPARQEAIRGTFDPEYLYYTLGKLEILKLRQDYQKQEGSNFSLRRFHDELLRHGAPPVRLLREVLLKDPASWNAVL